MHASNFLRTYISGKQNLPQMMMAYISKLPGPVQRLLPLLNTIKIPIIEWRKDCIVKDMLYWYCI